MRVPVYSDDAFERWRSAQNSKSCSWEKYSLIPLREKSRGVSGKILRACENLCFDQIRKETIVQVDDDFEKMKSGMRCTQKDPLIPSKEDLGRLIAKNFLCFIKICALSKPTRALLCRRTRPYMADNKIGTSPFVGDAPYLCLMRRNFWWIHISLADVLCFRYNERK